VLFTGQKLNRMAYRYVLVMESEEKLRSFMDKIIRVEGYQVLEMADEATLALPDLKVFDLASIEKSHIQRVLNYTRGDRAEAARLLKIGLTTLYRKVAEYQLK
jgi:transcriptional regulator with PAS, ATPase and Fis domain